MEGTYNFEKDLIENKNYPLIINKITKMLNDKNIIFYDKEIIKKIELINKNKKDLVIICDFDGTITKKSISKNILKLINSYFNKKNLNKKGFIKESLKLGKRYFKIEKSFRINKEKRIIKDLDEISILFLKILKKYNINEKLIKLLIKEYTNKYGNIIREDFKNFLEFTKENNIPVIIFSANFTFIIKIILETYDLFLNNIYILSNIITKDKNNFVNNIIIHRINKNNYEIISKNKDIPEFKKIDFILNNKKYFILIGDGLYDADLVNNYKFKNLKYSIKIAFFHKQTFYEKFFKYLIFKLSSFYSSINNLKDFQKKYDLILNGYEKDNFKFIKNILTKFISNKKL